MNPTRQDAWTKEEDVLLAKVVLKYIKEDRTQLEAFKQVANQLSRTSAACGFRWNATIRKQYKQEIEQAKKEKRHQNEQKIKTYLNPIANDHENKVDKAILLLKEMKYATVHANNDANNDRDQVVASLRKENAMLRQQLTRYDEAWHEMVALWDWVKVKK